MNFISRISERLRLIFYARPLRGGSLKKLYNTYNLRRPTAMLGPYILHAHVFVSEQRIHWKFDNS